MAGFNTILPPISLSFPEPVTALSFDPVSDVLWTGTNAGNVIAHCSTQGTRGVSFRVGNLAVQKITVGENYVRSFSVSGEGVGSWSKGGMNKWYYKCAFRHDVLACDSLNIFAVQFAKHCDHLCQPDKFFSSSSCIDVCARIIVRQRYDWCNRAAGTNAISNYPSRVFTFTPPFWRFRWLPSHP